MSRNRRPNRRPNLERLIAEAGSATRLARLANTNPSYLSQIRRGLPTARGAERAVGDELANKLEHAMGKPQGWMDTCHDALREDGPDAYARAVPAPSEATECPVVTWAEAGRWATLSAAICQDPSRERLRCPVPCSARSFAVRIDSESMAPTFAPADIVFVDPDVPPTRGRYIVVREGNTDAATVRQLLVESDREYLKAVNPDWPEHIVPLTGTIVGVVVFKGTIV